MKVKSTKVSGESKYRKQVPIFVKTIRAAHVKLRGFVPER